MSSSTRSTIRHWGAIAAIIAAFIVGAAVDRMLIIFSDRAVPLPAGHSPDFPLINEAWDAINGSYVDRTALQTKPLTYGAIEGMVNALGDTGHSTFLTPEAVRQEQTFLQGRYVGVGLEVGMRNGHVTIAGTFDNSPALSAGLRAGEEILKVDGRSIAGLTIQQVTERIIGPAGTSVTLTIFNPADNTTLNAVLKRRELKIENVSWQPVPGTTYADLRIAAFSNGVSGEVRTALAQMLQEKLTGIVLDLRNDPGGELNEAVGIASEFLKGGDVLLEKDSQGNIQKDPVRPGGLAADIPLVVLVNGGTASAAEIVAGALQDVRHAALVGETTIGTGTVLQDFRLSDGSVLLLAVREWLTPLGRVIWHKGITPNMAVSLPPSGQLLIPSMLKGMSQAAFTAAGDLQMQRAIELLAAHAPQGG